MVSVKFKRRDKRSRRRLSGNEIAERMDQLQSLLASGMSLRTACARLEISVPSYYRWRSRFQLNGTAGLRGTRDVILDAAKRVFLREGFGASLDAIAEEAGISRQTVYNQFEDKESLFVAVVETVYTQLLSKTPPPLLDGDLADVLMSVGRYLMSGGLDPNAVALFKIGLAEYRNNPELARVTQRLRLSHVLPSVTAELADYLESFMRRGIIRRGDAELIAEAFSSAVLGQARRRILSGEIAEVTDKWRGSMLLEVVSIFSQGLARRRPPGHRRARAADVDP